MRIAIIGTRKLDEYGVIKIAGYIKDTYGEDVILYSGNAEGVDQVVSYFEKANVFLPWRTFNKDLTVSGHYIVVKGNDNLWDKEITYITPHFINVGLGVRALLRRNAFIILGDKDRIPPVDLVIWHTGRGVAGGTSYGVKIARAHNIPVFEITQQLLELLPLPNIEKYKKPLSGVQKYLIGD